MRTTCPRCRRPERVCVCAEIRCATSRTRVVFLQHPREARVPVTTCRLAHLSLPNSELHVGMRPEGDPRLEALARAPGTMVLFPGPGSVDVEALTEPPQTLFVVDGSWINARKVVQRSPLLATLPRLGLSPTSPSNYRIRREPAPHCLSTIEAVAHVLGVLEGAPERFTPMLGSFTRLVDLQLSFAASRGERPPRHARTVSAVDRMRALGDRLVLLYAEASSGAEPYVQWVAARHGTAERFESIFRPAVPILHGRSRDLCLKGVVARESLAEALARWRAFSRPGDVPATWAQHPIATLEQQGIILPASLDLKRVTTDRARRTLGGVEHLATRLGAKLPEGRGRPVRQLLALQVVVGALLEGRPPF